MDSQRVDKLINILEEFRNIVGEQVATKLELEKCIRMIKRLSSFSSECEECYQLFIDLENHLMQLNDRLKQLGKSDFKYHKQKIDHISSHLHKRHKLIASGYYLTVFMSIGLSLGVVFGLLIFDNIGLGLPIGIGIGVGIGAILDADAKKKGMVL